MTRGRRACARAGGCAPEARLSAADGTENKHVARALHLCERLASFLRASRATMMTAQQQRVVCPRAARTCLLERVELQRLTETAVLIK